MTMKCLLRGLLAVAFATALSLGAGAPTSAKPEIVFILADDLGNAAADGDNVWPLVERKDKLHYDCSKLDSLKAAKPPEILPNRS